MRLALGLSPHTGWAACVLAGGSLREPRIEAREELALVDDADRFVFHRAAEMKRADAEHSVARVRTSAIERAAAVFRRLKEGRDVRACAIVAKLGQLPELDVIVASHPRIHSAEGMFYRDVLVAAASASGLTPRVLSPAKLDANDPALVAAGRVAGKPWNRDLRIAALAAWLSLSERRT